jgi:hypothetical protein
MFQEVLLYFYHARLYYLVAWSRDLSVTRHLVTVTHITPTGHRQGYLFMPDAC